MKQYRKTVFPRAVLRLAGVALAVFLLPPATALAGSYAIAMHGAPRQPAGFTSFDYVNPNAPKGGKVVLGRLGTFDSLNPFIIKGIPAAGLDLTFDRLLKRGRNEPFTLYGLIAESVETPDDRSSVTFTIRPRARFHDGTPITADDVIFSLKTLREKGRPNHRLFYKQVVRMERLGIRKVKLVFKDASNREMPLIMGLMPILSRKYYQKHEFEKTTLTPPLGSGPYRVKAVDQGRSITYERVADYWGRDLAVNKGQYNFDEIKFDYFRDAVVALEAFKAGLIDFRAEPDPGRWVTAYNTPARQRGDIILEEISHGRPAGMYAFVFNSRRPIFRDPQVRAALAYAFDFKWLNKHLFHGAYRRTASFFEGSELAAAGPISEAEKKLLAPFRGQLAKEVFTKVYRPPASTGNGRGNIRAAFRLLGRAGWYYKGQVLMTADGRPAAFEILLVNPRRERLALSLKRNLKRLGIAVTIRTVDSAQYQFRLDDYDFDMIIHRWDESLSPGSEQAFYWGSKAANEEGTRNYPGIESPAADVMIRRITEARTRQGLIDATRALDRVLQWGHYVLPLFYLPRDRVAYWNKFEKPKVTPLYGYQFDAWWMAAGGGKRQK